MSNKGSNNIGVPFLKSLTNVCAKQDMTAQIILVIGQMVARGGQDNLNVHVHSLPTTTVQALLLATLADHV